MQKDSIYNNRLSVSENVKDFTSLLTSTDYQIRDLSELTVSYLNVNNVAHINRVELLR